ncbi:pseudouridine-5'-phosphate glycosidase [Truepera radiovictrix]|uniref:Pseudouridine-5'-phosphate glycosidase n=1 Tax=Truepera radiovictrix (strain DSM 17093 / CIP 108686 / LMG 22925 / RQ-24) TaxID=649638 RepID=D7CQW7_TRURR|nr:pseudouridine-5'-phosphate glycosidase [Truepera radiovictrix]ADI15101.1 Indigoidine synthase A family protein [Truepera radiovictrix DSM 17093]WMT56346.1 pseudouridine-5'-phosphate glycosidase [Truepera radiovictrix]
MRLHPAVARALATGQAVVALESTVITHGLPRPQNLALARALERAVREAGAVPATIGLLGGEVVVGLSDGELAYLAEAPAAKATLWNLADLTVRGADAGTTVAATLHLAARAGILVFATGGIGGVHGAYDESADLAALARYPLVVVSAGAKSILDQAATLERLESLGVSVIGYRSDRFAGFHVPQTALPVPARCDTPEEVAERFRAARALGLPGALLVAKPVSEGLTAEEVDGWLGRAQREAAAAGLRGKDVTPFLLRRFDELSEGRATDVNVRLLEENARLGAQVALALQRAPASTP